MTADTLQDAMDSANRFLALAGEAIAQTRDYNKTAKYSVELLKGTKATGALRRASMTLSRALSEMRKP